jgi:predicted enzyme related to lactoylglutathione lyase
MQVLINIDVEDVDRAVDFYAAVGLRLSRRLFGGSVAELSGGGVTVHLLPAAAGSVTAQGAGTRDFTRHWTPLHLDFCVDDLDAAIARAVSAGATLESEARQHEWGRIATLGDPFGHGFCLIQLTAEGYDHVAG